METRAAKDQLNKAALSIPEPGDIKKVSGI
jgi:hypothetical protein